VHNRTVLVLPVRYSSANSSLAFLDTSVRAECPAALLFRCSSADQPTIAEMVIMNITVVIFTITCATTCSFFMTPIIYSVDRDVLQIHFEGLPTAEFFEES
jgi:hypothetical protein